MAARQLANMDYGEKGSGCHDENRFLRGRNRMGKIWAAIRFLVFLVIGHSIMLFLADHGLHPDRWVADIANIAISSTSLYYISIILVCLFALLLTVIWETKIHGLVTNAILKRAPDINFRATASSHKINTHDASDLELVKEVGTLTDPATQNQKLRFVAATNIPRLRLRLDQSSVDEDTGNWAKSTGHVIRDFRDLVRGTWEEIPLTELCDTTTGPLVPPKWLRWAGKATPISPEGLYRCRVAFITDDDQETYYPFWAVSYVHADLRHPVLRVIGDAQMTRFKEW